MLVRLDTLQPWLGERLGEDEVLYPRNIEELWSAEDLAAIGLAIPTPFAAPDGQVITGAPRYETDGANGVREVYDTQDAPAPPRRLIAKSVVQERVDAIGKLGDALTAMLADPISFARWFAPDWPNVYADDTGLLAMLAAIGCTPDQIAAITAPMDAA
ncbi:MAG: hypothetical protein WDM92_06315 [Caulobacteraceae bacterium]